MFVYYGLFYDALATSDETTEQLVIKKLVKKEKSSEFFCTLLWFVFAQSQYSGRQQNNMVKSTPSMHVQHILNLGTVIGKLLIQLFSNVSSL